MCVCVIARVFLSTHTHLYVYVYLVLYGWVFVCLCMCSCVCVCVVGLCGVCGRQGGKIIRRQLGIYGVQARLGCWRCRALVPQEEVCSSCPRTCEEGAVLVVRIRACKSNI
jgi:hypothetical protein